MYREERDYELSTRTTTTMATATGAAANLVSSKSRVGIASTTPTAEAAAT